MKKLIIFSIIAITAFAVFAQTNSPLPVPAPSAPSILNPPSNAVSQAAQDFAKGFQDLGLNVSVAGLEKFLFGAFLFARFAMKYMLKDKSSKLYSLATHVALHLPTAPAPASSEAPAAPVASTAASPG